MSFISYAQNFKDVMLWRALKGVQNGFYIDVGAHEPINGSVTKSFYNNGWNGINIEPIEAPFELLKADRSRDINLQICAGSDNGEIDIYDVLPTGLATIKSDIAEEYQKAGNSVAVKRVPVQTLSQICTEYVSGEIHFLKIDVEGFEKELPYITQWLITISEFFINNSWIILRITASLITSFLYWKSTPSGKYKLDEIILKMPLISYFSKTLKNAFMNNLQFLIAAIILIQIFLFIYHIMLSSAWVTFPVKTPVINKNIRIAKGPSVGFVILDICPIFSM